MALIKAIKTAHTQRIKRASVSAIFTSVSANLIDSLPVSFTRSSRVINVIQQN